MPYLCFKTNPLASNLIAYLRWSMLLSANRLGHLSAMLVVRHKVRTGAQFEVQPSIHIFQTHETSVLAPREGCDNEWPTDAMRRLYYACDPQ